VCVGHHLADQILPDQDQTVLRQQARDSLSLEGPERWLCVMPGSRHDEVARLAPIFLDTAFSCLRRWNDLGVVIPCANPERRKQLDALIGTRLEREPEVAGRIRVLDGESHLAMQASDLVLMASGTATLEALLLKRPMVVAYRLSRLTWLLASRLVKVPYVSLPNLLARRQLVPEFLQHAATPQAFEQALGEWLDDPAKQQQVIEAFEEIHLSLRRDANRQAATAIIDLIESTQDVSAVELADAESDSGESDAKPTEVVGAAGRER